MLETKIVILTQHYLFTDHISKKKMLNQRNYEKYLTQIEQKIFHEFDKDKNNRFNRKEFPVVLNLLTKIMGADVPVEDDVNDIFDLLDINGDGTIDRTEFMSLMKTLFKVLQEQKIEIKVDQETNIII